MKKQYTAGYLKRKLQVFFSKYPPVKLVYFFGSQAGRKTGALSDVDMAILWKGEDQERLLEGAELQHKIRELFNDERFEVGSLNGRPLSFCYNVIKNGVCIYGDEGDRVRYESYILNEYLDFEYLAQEYNKAFKKAVLKGG